MFPIYRIFKIRIRKKRKRKKKEKLAHEKKGHFTFSVEKNIFLFFFKIIFSTEKLKMTLYILSRKNRKTPKSWKYAKKNHEVSFQPIYFCESCFWYAKSQLKTQNTTQNNFVYDYKQRRLDTQESIKWSRKETRTDLKGP